MAYMKTIWDDASQTYKQAPVTSNALSTLDPIIKTL